MKTATVPLTSSRRRSQLIEWNGRPLLASRPLFYLPPHSSDTYHVVVAGDRVDTLAHSLLGSVALDWVIMDLNGIRNALELPEGALLRIPDRARLTPEVLKRARKR